MNSCTISKKSALLSSISYELFLPCETVVCLLFAIRCELFGKKSGVHLHLAAETNRYLEAVASEVRDCLH